MIKLERNMHINSLLLSQTYALMIVVVGYLDYPIDILYPLFFFPFFFFFSFPLNIDVIRLRKNVNNHLMNGRRKDCQNSNKLLDTYDGESCLDITAGFVSSGVSSSTSGITSCSVTVVAAFLPFFFFFFLLFFLL